MNTATQNAHYSYTNLGTALFPSYQVYREVWAEVGSNEEDSSEAVGPRHMTKAAAIAYIKGLQA